MNSEVRTLFHELADLTPVERERAFHARGTEPGIRAEVESLLQFDSTEDQSLTHRVCTAAGNLLSSDEMRDMGRCGQYRLIRLLGSGGMGAVYLAERSDGEVQQTVAVKVLRFDDQRPMQHFRFLKERQFLASLKHPSIVRMIDAGRMEGGRPYLVMEYVEGVAIDTYASRVSLRERLEMFVRVCDGVSHAHRHLIIHRDLKPSNILVDSSGEPKVLDFGIAKLLDETGDATLTVERLISPGYGSPEQALGGLQTTATDVYSLGAVLYKLMTDRSPHQNATGKIDVMMERNAIPAASHWNASVHADVDAILAKSMRHEPEERYASIGALARDVRAFLDSKPVEARSGNAWYRARKLLRRYRVPVVASALVIASLSAGLYVANRQRLIAERRFGQLRHLSVKVLDLDREIANLAGAKPARIQLIATTKEYLEGLESEATGDRALSLEVVSAYLRVARIQGVAIGFHLAQYAEADRSLQKAESLVTGVVARDPRNRNALQLAANIAHDRALVADSEVRPADVLSYSRDAAQWWDRLRRLGDLTTPEINNAAYAFANLAQIHINMNRFEDAVDYARRGVEVSRDAVSIPGPQAQARCLLANSLLHVGDFNGAMENARVARSIADHGTFDNQGYRTQIWIRVRCQQGRVLGEDEGVSLNRANEAAAFFREAFDLAVALSKRDVKDNYSRAWIAASGQELGNILRHSDPKQALQVYDESLDRIREVPNDAVARRNEATLLAGSSYAATSLRHPVDARERVDLALRLLRQTKDYPTEKIKPGSEVEATMRALADQYAETGELRKAADVYRELLAKMMATKPEEGSNLLNAVCISRCYAALAPILRRTGSDGEAASLDSQRTELWRAWDRKLPGNPFVVRQLDGARHP